MSEQIIDITDTLLLQEERTRLLRLCIRMTSNVDIAEDLVQETLLIAWRHAHTLRDPQKRPQWLAGIARNLCLHWQRQHGRDTAHYAALHTFDKQATALIDLDDTLMDDFDIELELERKELVALLDRALALLPVETRMALIQHYVEQSSLAEIASRLGTNAGAIAMRLQRGKLALRRILTSEMQHELTPYMPLSVDEWETTPLWCYYCGKHHLLGKRDALEGLLYLKCSLCTPEADDVLSRNHLHVLREIRGYKPLLSRLFAWCDRYYRTALQYSSIRCEGCGETIPTRLCTVKELPAWVLNEVPMVSREDERLVATFCETCHSSSRISLDALILTLPESRQFIQEHSRIRNLPQLRVETEGRDAIVTRFESVNASARLVVVSAYDTYETLRVEIEGGE